MSNIEKQESYERGVSNEDISVGICLSMNFENMPEGLRENIVEELNLFTQNISDLIEEVGIYG